MDSSSHPISVSRNNTQQTSPPCTPLARPSARNTVDIHVGQGSVVAVNNEVYNSDTLGASNGLIKHGTSFEQLIMVFVGSVFTQLWALY